MCLNPHCKISNNGFEPGKILVLFACSGSLEPNSGVEREGQTLLLLTKRSEKLRSHSGQVSFPGGKQDEQDQSSLDTALREAREEIGLESKSVRILGCLDQIISLHFYLVTPFVGLIPSDFEAKVDSVETESIFEVPLEFFLDSGLSLIHI